MDQNRERKIPPLFTSIAVHALLLGIAIFILSREPEEGTNSGPIQIDSINEKKTAKIRPQHRSKAATENQSIFTGKAHQVSLSDLGMRLNPHDSPPAESQTETAQPSEALDEDEWDVMNPDPKVARFNQYIYRTVQGWLDRNSSSNLEQIYGTVKVKIWFDENGNYLENETEYDAIDPHFQHIVALALRNSFAVPVPRPFLYIHHKFSIVRMVGIRRF